MHIGLTYHAELFLLNRWVPVVSDLPTVCSSMGRLISSSPAPLIDIRPALYPPSALPSRKTKPWKGKTNNSPIVLPQRLGFESTTFEKWRRVLDLSQRARELNPSSLRHTAAATRPSSPSGSLASVNLFACFRFCKPYCSWSSWDHKKTGTLPMAEGMCVRCKLLQSGLFAE